MPGSTPLVGVTVIRNIGLVEVGALVGITAVGAEIAGGIKAVASKIVGVGTLVGITSGGANVASVAKVAGPEFKLLVDVTTWTLGAAYHTAAAPRSTTTMPAL